jgi:hypothetical protein
MHSSGVEYSCSASANFGEPHEPDEAGCVIEIRA